MEEDTEDDEGEEDRPVSQSRVLTQPLNKRVVDSDNVSTPSPRQRPNSV